MLNSIIKNEKLRKEFTPKFLSLIKQGISKEQFVKDSISGVIVGIVALPLAIAFSIASGVSPDKGLITAVIAGFIISLLGGSRVQIGGPTGAFIVIVYGIVQQYGISGLQTATLMAGILLILMGAFRFGKLLKYVPHSLVVGFTSGIAVIIFSSQIKDFLGLKINKLPSEFLEKWISYFENIQTFNLYALLISVSTILLTFNFHRITKKIPGSFISIILFTLITYFFDIPVETIESKFGEIPNSIPYPKINPVDFTTIKELMKPAMAIALLGGIESLLSAVVADGMIGTKHRSNIELIAQGIANIASSLFGGIPATGAIARTATNVKNGGRTPIAGIIHALTLLTIMLFIAPYAKLIPLSCLSGILIVVAYNMGEWHSFISVLKSNRYDALVLFTTFILTVAFDLIVAIQVGMFLSSFIFMKRMKDFVEFKVLDKNTEKEELLEHDISNLPKNTLVYEITGPLFFGASQRFQEALTEINQLPKFIIIRMDSVPFIDATGIYTLSKIIDNYKKRNVFVILTELKKEVEDEIIKNKIIEESNITNNVDKAINLVNSL
jgi:SulP family sulfate permease